MTSVMRRVVLVLAGIALAFTAGGSVPALAASTHHGLHMSPQGGAVHSAAFLYAGAELVPGQSVQSSAVTLIMQLDGNLVVYLNQCVGNPQCALWASGTRGDNTAIMQGDGDFVIYPSNQVGNSGSAEWATHTYGYNVLVVQDDGNVVIYPVCCVGDTPVAEWATNT
jgi:hypothetical protein